MSEFDKIIGYKAVKLELQRLADIMKNLDKYKNLGVKMPKGLLLSGDPGVGKTLMANCLIKESGRKVFVCRKDKPNGNFVNEIRNIYNLAKESAPCIVLLDDMDKFANGDEMHRNAQEYVTVQSCIDCLEGEDVFTIATVNNKYNLPTSLLRAGRFDKNIEVDVPKGDDAVKIIQHYLKQKKYVSNINPAEIARILNGHSCAELETVVNEAGIYAGYLNKEFIEFDDIIKACMRIIFHAPEDNLNYDNVYMENTAYHEAGHAVVAEILEPNSVNLVSICNHIGDIGGVTSYYQDENYWQSKKYMENRVMVVLAGKAATEVIYGDCCDVGANDDIRRAIKIVERFIDHYCGYGFDKFEFAMHSSNNFLSRREDTVFAEMEKYYQMAKKIIIQNKNFFEDIAKMLIKKKTLVCNDIQQIRSKYKISKN